MSRPDPAEKARQAQADYLRASGARRDAFVTARAAGLSYREIAAAAGLTPSTVHHLVMGRLR